MIENFLYNTNGVFNQKIDIRFMDPFDHVLTSLINQAEEDKNFEQSIFMKEQIPEKSVYTEMNENSFNNNNLKY